MMMHGDDDDDGDGDDDDNRCPGSLPWTVVGLHAARASTGLAYTYRKPYELALCLFEVGVECRGAWASC